MAPASLSMESKISNDMKTGYEERKGAPQVLRIGVYRF